MSTGESCRAVGAADVVCVLAVHSAHDDVRGLHLVDALDVPVMASRARLVE